MASYINKNGEKKTIDRKFILSVRRHIVEDMERELYQKLSPAYRKKFSVEKWVREQSIGRLFMTGDKDKSIYTEFYQIFYPQAMEQSLLILKDQDESHNVVTDMFEMFRTRRKYVRNKEVSDLQKTVREKERLIQNRKNKIDNAIYKETRSFKKELEEIAQLQVEISQIEDRILESVREEKETYEKKLNSYDGLSYDDIYALEARDFEKSEDNQWFSDDLPISGYIAIASKNLSLMRFNKLQGDIMIPMSKLGASSESEDEELFDIANLRRTIKEDEEEIEIVNKEDIDDPDEENPENHQQTIIEKCKEILERCDGSSIMSDFLFGGLTHDQIREKYNFNTSGAVKSRIFRMRSSLQDRLLSEIENEQVMEKQKANGVVKKYYDNGSMTCLKSLTKYENYQPVFTQEFYENGKLKREIAFRNGVYDGIYVEYHDNGKHKKCGRYENGKKVDRWVTLHKNGEPDEIVVYYENGNKSFEIYSEDATGKIEQCGKIKGDVVVEHFNQGDYIARHENGNIKMSGTLKDDRRIGMWREFYEDGKLHKEIIHRGENHKDFRIYDKAGNIVQCGTLSADYAI